MLNLASLFVIERPFATAADVKRLAGTRLGCAPGRLEALLFFATQKQQSWLVASSREIALVVDRREEAQPRVSWTLQIERAENSILIGSKSEITGTIAIGGKRPRLFSKKLFADEPIRSRLHGLLERARSNASKAA